MSLHTLYLEKNMEMLYADEMNAFCLIIVNVFTYSYNNINSMLIYKECIIVLHCLKTAFCFVLRFHFQNFDCLY